MIGPLFVSKWNAENYKKGLHHIHVEVEDEDGRIQTISQPFSLDGTRLSFDLLPRFILMSNASQVVSINKYVNLQNYYNIDLIQINATVSVHVCVYASHVYCATVFVSSFSPSCER